MKISQSSTIGRFAIFYSCLSLATASTTIAIGQEWSNDIQFASSERGVADCGVADCGCPTCDCGCCAPMSCDCGYCFTCPVSDELSRRMAAITQSLECCGIQYVPGVTQFYQGNTTGGAEQVFEYGGKVDQVLIVDGGKLAGWNGLTMTMHVETRFGDDVNFDAVGFAPANVAMLYPKENEHDTAITNLTFDQALNDSTHVTWGKFNALDMFNMLYPETGRGVEGFMNASAILPLAVARVAPLAYMGAGILSLNGTQPQGGLFVYDTQDCSTTSGFDDLFDNGCNIMGFWRFFTNTGGLPGSHFFGGIWSTGEFVAFDPTGFVIVPEEGIIAPRQDGAYTLLYILEQTMWMDCYNKDRRVVLLSQWGLADEATSPIGWSANVTVQAYGVNRARPHDSAGVAYFHTGISDDLKNLFSSVLTLQDVDGVELYYNMALTKSFQLTSDLQIIEPANEQNDTAVVVGVRGTLGF